MNNLPLILKVIKEKSPIIRISFKDGVQAFQPFDDPGVIFTRKYIHFKKNGAIIKTMTPKDTTVTKTTRKEVPMIATYGLMEEERYYSTEHVHCITVIDDFEGLKRFEEELKEMYGKLDKKINKINQNT